MPRTKFRPRVEALPENWQGPLLSAPAYYAGKAGKFTMRADVECRANGTAYGQRDKGARRATRAKRSGLMSSIERGIMAARADRLNIERLASNPHEAKRYVKQVAAERKRFKQWTVDWYAMWRAIGTNYAQLTAFARASQAPMETP